MHMNDHRHLHCTTKPCALAEYGHRPHASSTKASILLFKLNLKPCWKKKNQQFSEKTEVVSKCLGEKANPQLFKSMSSALLKLKCINVYLLSRVYKRRAHHREFIFN